MEHDLDNAAKALLVDKKIDKMLEIVENAKSIRTVLNEAHRSILKGSHEVDGLDEMSISMGLARVSDEFFNEFETTLHEIAELAKDRIDSLNIKNVGVIEGLIVFVSQLKPRSIRHLEGFLSAFTDGEWVDGLWVGKGRESEFRCIDRCSDSAKAEFGLVSKK